MKKNKKIVILSSAIAVTTLVSSFSFIENSTNQQNNNHFANIQLTQNTIPEAELSIDEYGVQKLFVNYQGIRYGIKYVDSIMGDELVVDGISRQTLRDVNDLIVIQDNLTFSWNNQNYTFEVKKIKEKAFKGDNYENATIVIGNNIKEIGDQTFQRSKFKKIVFPGNNQALFSNALSKAQYVRNIDRFGVSAFEGAAGLPEVLIFDDSIREIQTKAFANIQVEDFVRSISYYSYKINVASDAFTSTHSIKVEPTKFKKLESQIEHNNKQYQQIKIDDLSTKDEFQNEQYLKDYIIKNIRVLFENSPIKLDSSGTKLTDLLEENISFDLEVLNNEREIYLTNLSLDYWYDENGNIVQNKKQIFGNLAFIQTIKKTDIKNPIQALDLGLEDKTAQQASKIISNEFIFNKLDKILIGDHKIIDANQIKNVLVQVENNQIQLSFSLANNTWYNFEGDLVDSEKTFTTIINGFQRKNQTQVINPIEASSLGWTDLTAKQAELKLNSEFIFQNIDQFLIGDYLLSNSSSIEVISINILNNEINLVFRLSRGTWYDEEGRLGKDEKEFQALIHHFKDEVVHTETKIINPIDASTINLNNKTIGEALNLINENFIFLNLSKFFIGSHEINDVSKINIISKIINGKKIDLVIELSEGTAYDSSGNLIGNKKTFNTSIYNFKQEIQYEETKIKDPIQALDINLNNVSAKDAQSKITEQFILDNKTKFFTGYLNLQNINEIIDLNVSISNNDLIVSFKLKQNTWADKDDQIGTTDKLFNTKIVGFKQEVIKQETQINNPIEANLIGLGNKTIQEAISLITSEYIFEFIQIFLKGDYEISNSSSINIIEKNIDTNKIVLIIEFGENTCYDNQNSLINKKVRFTTEIINFKQEVIKQETQINNSIEAKYLWNNKILINEAINQIDSDFIFKNKSIFFRGDNEIKNSSQIVVNKKIVNNEIHLTIQLAANTWYGSNNEIGKNPKTFTTTIINFENEEIETKEETKVINPIEAQNLNWDNLTAEETKVKLTNSFIYQNKEKFLSGDNLLTNETNIRILDIRVSNNKIILSFSLSSGTWYDANNQLGKFDKTFSTIIQNFRKNEINEETKIINPIDAVTIGINNKTIDESFNLINELFIFNNLNNFFNGNYEIDNVSKIKISKKEIDNVQKRINLEIELSENSAYDVEGNLINKKVKFETYIFNFKQETQNEETKIINPIQSSILGLNNHNVQEAQKRITNQFILDNKTKFFTGYLNLQNINEIIDLNVSISNNDLIVTFKLKANTWANENGQLGNFDKLFSTKITNFKETQIKEETQIKNPIEARLIGLENKTINEALTLINKEFIFANITNILTGNYEILNSNKIENVVKNIEGNKIKLTITLSANTCYDSNGYLVGFSKTFETYIINFAQDEINKPTIIKTPIEAFQINLSNLTIYEANERIDSSLIFNNLAVFFEGDHKINQINQINVEKQIVKDKIVLNITLASNTYYDENGKLEQISRTFITEIINFKPEEQKQETKIINPIQANVLGLNNLTANQALSQINASLIFKFRTNIFEGDNNINSQENIVRIETSISNNTILLSFYLISSTWYDEKGNLGNSEKLFETRIINFKEEIYHKPTLINNPIDAVKINLGNKIINDAVNLIDNNFIFNNINKIFSGDYEINRSSQIYIVSKVIVDEKIKLVISLEPRSYYDENGQLSNEEKLFTTFIFNFKKEEQKQETKIINPIESSQVGLNTHTAEEAKDKITNEFIYNNKTKFFEGYLNLLSANDILELSVKVSNNELIVSFKLKANTWSDADGNIGTENKLFTTSIINFKESQIKKETRINNPIEASLINLNNLTIDETLKLEFKNIVFDKKNYFFEGDHEIVSIQNIIKVDKVKEGNKLKLSITLAENTWYDNKGSLVNKSKIFETEIINFKQPDEKKDETIINNPIEASIIGLGDQYISNAINLIDSEFIFKNKLKFFKGDLNISKANQITISKKQREGNKITLTIVLASNTWYNQNGILENRTKSFETIIENFKSDQKQETKISNPIQASSLDLEHLTIEEAIKIVDDSLVYRNITVFFIGDYEINSNSIESFAKNIVGNAIEISITLKANTCYDKDGNLIANRTTKFITKIINFKESPKINKTYVINPINASSIGLDDKLAKDVISENIINAEFIFENKAKFIGGSNQIKYSSYINVSSVEQVGNRKIKLIFTLSANSWYDENGELSQSSITFETMLVKFKLDKDLPIDADEYDGVPWTKWWNITLLCIAAAAFPLLIIWIIRKIYKIKSRK